MALIPTVADAQAANAYRCTDCQHGFDATQGYDVNGAFVCQACYGARAAVRALQPAAVAARPRPRPVVPEYGAIKIGATVVEIMAALTAAVGVFEIIVVGISLTETGISAGAGAVVIAALLPVGATFAVAALLFMVSSLARAVRDIARNSFRH